MNDYCRALRLHYENHFKSIGEIREWGVGPTEKLNSEFSVLEIPPSKHPFWTYLTVGMSLNRLDENFIECFVYSPKQSDKLVELLTINASFHKNSEFLNLHHTVNIGEPWLDESICNHALISLPYIEGEKLENFYFGNKLFKIYWLLPISEAERDFKIKNGIEALESLFEKFEIDYLNPKRKSLV